MTDSKIKIGWLTDNISDDISAEAYDEWTEVLDTIEELIEDIESSIEDAENIEDEEYFDEDK